MMRGVTLLLLLLVAARANILYPIPSIRGKYFERIATFFCCEQFDPDCKTDVVTSAEIVDVYDNGDRVFLVYTDGAQESLGFVDITNPEEPTALFTRPLPGEPTSVAVCGKYAVVVFNTSPDFVNVSGGYIVYEFTPTPELVAQGDLPGQPDNITPTNDCSKFVVAIENERNEDLNDGVLPQLPAGLLAVIDSSDADPGNWMVSEIELTGLNVDDPSDPEPEYISINDENIAVVTLQENNGLVLVNLNDESIISSFTAGTVDLENVDLTEEGEIKFEESADGVPREPDAVTWINNDRFFATADEGDFLGGTRGFTIFNTDGKVIYTETDMDYVAARVGHYPESRSGNKGNEPEGITYAKFGVDELLFVLSERSSLVYVYDVSPARRPSLVQVLPAGVAPEGVVAMPDRKLLVVASEEDDRSGNIRSSISIYRRGATRPAYPTIASANEEGSLRPIPWGALSGLSGQPPSFFNRFNLLTRRYLYAVHDNYYIRNRVFTIDYTLSPARIVSEAFITDARDILRGMESTLNLQDAVNEDNTVNLDLEGIAVSEEGGFWVVSEGRPGSDRSGPKNFLLKLNDALVITDVYTLDLVADTLVTNFGFEGVTEWDGRPVVCMQRPFNNEDFVRIGVLNREPVPTWEWYNYALSQPGNPETDWVGLSDITHVGGGEFYVVERDNRGGPDAVIKKIFSFSLDPPPEQEGEFEFGRVFKTEVTDLIPDLKAATKGPVPDKVEGLAMDFRGRFYIVTDNDGVDGSNGETLFLSLGRL